MITETIDPEALSNRDVEALSDMITEILSEKYGRCVASLSFSIEVTFDLEEEEE